MESGWIVNFKDGTRIAYDEKSYKTLNKNQEGIRSEEHWFSLEDAVKSNPGIMLIKGC